MTLGVARELLAQLDTAVHTLEERDRQEVMQSFLGSFHMHMPCLRKMDQQAAMVAVWATHNGREEEGVVRLGKRGIQLDENTLRNVAYFYRSVWGMDPPQGTEGPRPDCHLCGRELPAQAEILCECFRVAHVAYHYACDEQSILDLAQAYPQIWRTKVVQTIQCQKPRCGWHQTIQAGVVRSHYQQGNTTWRGRKFCQTCHYADKPTQPSRRPNRPARKSAPPPKATPSVAPTVKLNEEDLKAFAVMTVGTGIAEG
jgi:hypothetical protein